MTLGLDGHPRILKYCWYQRRISTFIIKTKWQCTHKRSHRTQRVHVAKLHGMFTEGQMLIRTQRVEEA